MDFLFAKLQKILTRFSIPTCTLPRSVLGSTTPRLCGHKSFLARNARDLASRRRAPASTNCALLVCAPGRTADYRISPSRKLLPSQKFLWAGLAVWSADQTSLRLSIPTVCRAGGILREHKFQCLQFVLPVGIEPTSQAPQACVLSIERRERSEIKNSVYREL